MSRIGNQFIKIPEKVNVKLDGQKILVDGPKGSLSRILPSLICCTLDDANQKLFLEKTQETKLSQALYGLSRTLVANMVTGVSSGFEKRLQITGVGYRAQLEGTDLVLNMGYSHPVKMITPNLWCLQTFTHVSTVQNLIMVKNLNQSWIRILSVHNTCKIRS